MIFLYIYKKVIQSPQAGFVSAVFLPCFSSLLYILSLLFFSSNDFVSINQDAEKLAGEEHAWKEVKDAVNEVRYPKSKEGILSVTGCSLSFSCENNPESPLVYCSSFEICFLKVYIFILF